MQLFPPTVIIRHCRENLKKCSLRGLESRPDFLFFTYPHFSVPLPNLKGYILLTLEAQALTAEDGQCGLLLLDGTWRYAEKMEKFILGKAVSTAASGFMEEKTPEIPLIRRSLPSHYRTAYPRVQNDCIDPTRGLSSIEAIYLCYRLLGRKTEGLLDQYYWRESFLEKNQLPQDVARRM